MQALHQLEFIHRTVSYKVLLFCIEYVTCVNLSVRLSRMMSNTHDDIEGNFRSLLQSTLTMMNLVTREEFDVQSAVLQRTREKLEQLEKQIEKLK